MSSDVISTLLLTCHYTRRGWRWSAAPAAPPPWVYPGRSCRSREWPWPSWRCVPELARHRSGSSGRWCASGRPSCPAAPACCSSNRYTAIDICSYRLRRQTLDLFLVGRDLEAVCQLRDLEAEAGKHKAQQTHSTHRERERERERYTARNTKGQFNCELRWQRRVATMDRKWSTTISVSVSVSDTVWVFVLGSSVYCSMPRIWQILYLYLLRNLAD